MVSQLLLVADKIPLLPVIFKSPAITFQTVYFSIQLLSDFAHLSVVSKSSRLIHNDIEHRYTI